jgi:hypothetical protein
MVQTFTQRVLKVNSMVMDRKFEAAKEGRYYRCMESS